jgi:PAS domain S-box-containing protein
MTEAQCVKLLLVEDDEDDYIITRSLLSEIKGRVYTLDWVRTFDEGLEAMIQNRHDACLLDYRLGAQDGVELTSIAMARGCQAPVILLTGMGEHQVDLAAMKAGASDYLVKNRLDANLLERSIRYAIERKRAAASAAFNHARLAAFGAEVGLALTRPASLEQILGECTKAMIRYLGGALAQIWVQNDGGTHFRRLASTCSGDIVDNEALSRPLLDAEKLATGQPALVTSCSQDRRTPSHNWLIHNRIESYAAFPLLLEERFVGVMALYSEQALTEAALQEMSSVAHGIALCIERKQSKEALDASEGKYRAVVETIREVIFQTDEFGHWTFLNPAWAEATGFTLKEALGTFFIDYIHHDDREDSRHIFLQLLERRMDYCRYETRFLTKGGKIRWMEVYIQLRLSREGVSLGTSGSLNDITERKLAELQIQKLAAFPRVNPNPVLEFTPDGSLGYMNDAAKTMVEALKQRDIHAILPPRVSEIIRRCSASCQNHYREQVVVAGRTLTWSFFPIPASQVVHCYGADVTDIVNLEAQFRHAQKLESVGQLAAGVAHDFNNILTVIQGYTDRLMKQCAGNPSATQQLGQILDAATRAASLTRQLLAFSRKQVMQPRVLDLNSAIKSLNSMLARLLGEDIGIEAAFAPELPSIEADAGMLEQIIMNLAVNARDAMPGGGRLTLRTSAVELTEADLVCRANARAGRFVCLQVTDTGCGMDATTLSRIFEPFFTTKEVGKGTGLGLATVYGIVKQHNGWIEVSSTIGAGSTFSVFFPAISKTAENRHEKSPAAVKLRGSGETILLVEDEADLREMTRDVLRGYDYRIVEAGSGVEALKAWDAADGKIDLLLTDMVMPDGLNGRQLAALLRKRSPDLKVIYSSGYSAALLAGGSDSLDGLFLSKPYSPPELATLVRTCLDEEGTMAPA